MGLGRSATWICPPCPCLPCTWVGEVTWFEGGGEDEKDGTEEEGEVACLRGERKRWN